MASKKASGSTRNGRDSHSKRRGVKRFSGQSVLPGTIIVRQKGTCFYPGQGVGMGRDFTIYSRLSGRVRFEPWGKKKQKVSVCPLSSQEA